MSFTGKDAHDFTCYLHHFQSISDFQTYLKELMRFIDLNKDFIVSCKYMNFREQYTSMYHSNIFMIIHGHIISYTFVNTSFPPRYMKIYFTGKIIFSAVVPQTLRIMQTAYGLYISLNYTCPDIPGHP